MFYGHLSNKIDAKVIQIETAMNFGESAEESSSSGRENGAAPSASTDSDRPHKKARFPWQIKGKHHLKNQPEFMESSTPGPAETEIVTPPPAETETFTQQPEETETVTQPPVETETVTPPTVETETVIPPSPETDTPPLAAVVPTRTGFPFSKDTSIESFDDQPSLTKTQTNLFTDLINPRLTNPDGKEPDFLKHKELPIETVMALAETMLRDNNITPVDFLKKKEVKIKPNYDLGAGPSNPTPRDVRRFRREEEKCISRWQSTNTVRGCFDNTINRVMETWMSAPAEERGLAIESNHILSTVPNNDNVENEAILMAINAHGLHNMGVVPLLGGVPLMAPYGQLSSAITGDIPEYIDSDSSICSEDYERLRNLENNPCPSDDDSIHQDGGSSHQDDGSSHQDELSSDESADESADDSADDSADESADDSPDDSPDDSEHPWKENCENTNALSEQYYDNKHPTHQTAEEYSKDYEFINTAIIQAIQTKGLMAAGTDFG